MKSKHRNEFAKKPLDMKTNVKNYFKTEGKMLHGTYGKPTHGARGNKKY
ncbi:MAG: hypothetical protein JXD23_02755 [Spirochaetales bacterium]|nr:hypothetical protein [Spirochaetales bacterium]